MCAIIRNAVSYTHLVIKKTIENTLANIPGIICDGAKISCAAKIAASLDAAFLAHHLAMNGPVSYTHLHITGSPLYICLYLCCF